jgi:hypothetical protein
MAVYDRTNGSLSGRKWLSRTKQRIANNLGIIDGGSVSKVRKYRDDELDLLDAYYESRQYDDLQDWDEAVESEDYVAIRKRKPRIIYNAPKVIIDRVTAKLIGQSVFPQFQIEDDPDDTEFFRQVQKVSNFKAELADPIRKMLAAGSCFIRFSLVEGSPKIEHFQSKYCYPVFLPSGELESLSVKYVYEDQNDKDSRGNNKLKWYRLDLTQTADILYDNPEYKDGSEPQFEIVERVDHNLGWVQGEWFRTGKDKFKPDGPSLIGEILDFCDELNYSLSQSSQAVGYNQEPQLAITGMDEDDLEKLIRSSQKAWNLGHKDAKAEFLETDLKGVVEATNLRTDNRSRMLEVVRVVLMDPEKIGGQAQSGTALAILHAPLVELIDELRLTIEPMLRNLLIKIGMTMLAVGAQGAEIALETPPGYAPSSLDITVSWPPIFPPTLEDLLKKVQAGVAAKNAQGISRETLCRYLAKDFGVEDIEAELQKIEADIQEMAALNPFGSSSFGGK